MITVKDLIISLRLFFFLTDQMSPISLTIHIIDNNVLIYGSLVRKSWNPFKCTQVNKGVWWGELHSLVASCAGEKVISRRQTDKQTKKTIRRPKPHNQNLEKVLQWQERISQEFQGARKQKRACRVIRSFYRLYFGTT